MPLRKVITTKASSLQLSLHKQKMAKFCSGERKMLTAYSSHIIYFLYFVTFSKFSTFRKNQLALSDLH